MRGRPARRPKVRWIAAAALVPVLLSIGAAPAGAVATGDDGRDLRAQRVAEGFVCSDEVEGWGCPPLQPQVDAGSVRKGVYRQCAYVAGVVAFNGAWLKDVVCDGKAALIARDGAVIRDVRITDISIGVNANCVRWEGGTVVLDGLTCLRADMGVLGYGRHLTLQNSRIAETRTDGINLGHLVYACPLKAGDSALVVAQTRLSSPGSNGHVLKTGCATTRIVDSTLDGGARGYARLIDAFNGGALVIEDTDLVAGPAAASTALIGYGAEMRQRHSDNHVRVSGGRLDCRHLPIWGSSLRTWPVKLIPDAVTWAPGEARGCPQP
jgi:hypothetical protein